MRIQLASPSDVEAFKPELVEIRRRTFKSPPYSRTRPEADEFAESLASHAAEKGFRLVFATDADTGTIAGFAYGRTARKSQPWHDVVQAPLEFAGLSEWLSNAYQIVEFAVHLRVKHRALGVGCTTTCWTACLIYEPS